MTRRTHSTAEPIGIGDAIGHYRIIGVVGSGGLYVAEQRGIRGVSKIVALRCVRPEIAKSARFRELFLDAASIAPRFEHPNIVTIHEMGEVEGNYFVSMEYLPAENVASILTRCNSHLHVPPEIAASLVKQTANALQYLHDFHDAESRPSGTGLSEVHPSNVFVTYHGTVKLLDIGFRSLDIRGDAAPSRSDRGLSTPPSGERREIARVADRHEDVRNLGVVLWTCLTGQTPHFVRDNPEVEASELALAPSSVRADIPKALDAIALRALSREPFERFQSAHELSEALDQYLLRQDSWPTPRHVRRWMEQLFDADRASLQLQVAEGRDVERALASLGTEQRPGSESRTSQARTPVRPRHLWSTSHSVFSQLTRGSIAPARPLEASPSSGPHERLPVSSILARPTTPAPLTQALALPAEAPRAALPAPPQTRPWLLGAILGIGIFVTIGVVAILSSSGQSSSLSAAPQGPPAERGGVEVQSTPPGAAVFVDGEPTGLQTPVVLKGLADGRTVRLRVEKAGFASQEREVKVVGDAIETQRFELLASAGLVRFGGMPSDARVFVDDVQVVLESGKPVSLSVGPHAVRVETPSSLMFSGTVVIVAGEQTVHVDGAGATP